MCYLSLGRSGHLNIRRFMEERLLKVSTEARIPASGIGSSISSMVQAWFSHGLVHFTRQSTAFHQPYARTTLTEKSVKHEGPKLWNSLDTSLKKIQSLFLFKRKLITQLISKYL